MYGQALRVPGDFIPDSTRPWSPFAERSALLDRINTFKPVLTSQHGLTVAWMPKDLSAAEFVFIRHYAHQHSLRPPYDGPFRVLESKLSWSTSEAAQNELLLIDLNQHMEK